MFLEDTHNNKQGMQFCGVGIHHQNGVSKIAIITIVEYASTILLHTGRLWSEAISQTLWPFALSYATHMHNHLHHNLNEKLLWKSSHIPKMHLV